MTPVVTPLERCKKWTPNEFEQLIIWGALNDDRYELIEGDIVRKEERREPICVTMCLLQEQLMRLFPFADFCVRNQAFLAIGESAPEPSRPKRALNSSQEKFLKKRRASQKLLLPSRWLKTLFEVATTGSGKRQVAACGGRSSRRHCGPQGCAGKKW